MPVFLRGYCLNLTKNIKLAEQYFFIHFELEQRAVKTLKNIPTILSNFRKRGGKIFISCFLENRIPQYEDLRCGDLQARYERRNSIMQVPAGAAQAYQNQNQP